MMRRSVSFLMIFVRIVLLGSIVSACANTPNEINLMPAPAVYTDGVLDPFTDTSPINPLPYTRLFYATDRLPTNENEPNRFYYDERGGVVRLGVARIDSVRANITWEEARRISLAKNRTDKYPIRVSGVEEWGILDRSATMFTPPDVVGEDTHAAARAFAAAVNAKLAQSRRKDIYIYTHGYKVVFESPVLVATELWHFLGYDGVFIAYAGLPHQAAGPISATLRPPWALRVTFVSFSNTLPRRPQLNAYTLSATAQGPAWSRVRWSSLRC